MIKRKQDREKMCNSLLRKNCFSALASKKKTYLGVSFPTNKLQHPFYPLNFHLVKLKMEGRLPTVDTSQAPITSHQDQMQSIQAEDLSRFFHPSRTAPGKAFFSSLLFSYFFFLKKEETQRINSTSLRVLKNNAQLEKRRMKKFRRKKIEGPVASLVGHVTLRVLGKWPRKGTSIKIIV